MFEYDDDGKEWFGYCFSSEESDLGVVVGVFTGNLQYAEWYFRQITKRSKLPTLADQLNHLFEMLPEEAERAITNDRPALVRDIVRTRNRYAHGRFEEVAPSPARVHTLSVKMAALLCFAERVHEGSPREAISMAAGGSPYLRAKLGQTDAPPSKKFHPETRSTVASSSFSGTNAFRHSALGCSRVGRC